MVRPYRTAKYQSVEWERPAPPLVVRSAKQQPPALRSAVPQSSLASDQATAPDQATVVVGLIKIAVYGAIIAATTTSLTRLLPLHALQQERLSILAAEVERLDQRVAQVQVAIPEALNVEDWDLSQASAAMRERVNYIPPNQLHVRLDVAEPEVVPPETPSATPANLLGFLWPWR